MPTYEYDSWQLLVAVGLGLFAAVTVTVLVALIQLVTKLFGRIGCRASPKQRSEDWRGNTPVQVLVGHYHHAAGGRPGHRRSRAVSSRVS